MPHKKYSSCYWEKQEQHGSYGGLQPSIACAGEVGAYTTGFYPAPCGLLYMNSLRFARFNVASVWLRNAV